MKSRQGLAIKTYYFFFFSGVAALMPFIHLYFREIQLSGAQIGVLAALPPVVMLFSQPFWGMVSDTRNARRGVLILLCSVCAGVVLLFPLTQSFWFLVALLVVWAFFHTPITPIADSMAFAVLEKRGGDYGNLRVWGSIGFSLAVLGIGRILEDSGLVYIFYIHSALMAITILAAMGMPKAKGKPQPRVASRVPALLQNRVFVVFLLAMFLLHLAQSGTRVFFGIYMNDLGAGEAMIGLAMMLAAGSEIPIMFVASRFVNRFGASRLLMVSMGVFVLRWIAYSLVRDPATVLFVQLLHGLSFGVGYVAAVSFVNQAVPIELRTTGQTLFWGASHGAGAIIGTLIFGFLFDLMGVFAIFQVAAVIGVVSLVLMIAYLRDPARVQPPAAGVAPGN